MVKRFSKFEIIDAMRCDLCLFGDGDWSVEKLRAIKPALPPLARVIVIDTKLPCTEQMPNDRGRITPCKARMRHAIGKLLTLHWKWRTGIKIQTRYGCRLMSCEELVSSEGEVQLVLDYRSQVDPDQPRPLLAKRVMWKPGFDPMMPSG